MKIHMDYLEAKVEEYVNVKVQWAHEKRQLAKKIQGMEEKARERALEVEREINSVKEEMERKIA
jgi:tryptophanyl-tRNA synthetase